MERKKKMKGKRNEGDGERLSLSPVGRGRKD
jgi:hypothetical protein